MWRFSKRRSEVDLAKKCKKLGYMEVKTGELRNQLSRYLKRVQQTGDSIIVLDRNRPVAEIRPYVDEASNSRSDIWTRRAQLEVQSGVFDEDFELPERITAPSKRANPLD